MPGYQRGWYQEVSRVNFAVSFYVSDIVENIPDIDSSSVLFAPLNYRKQLLFTFFFFFYDHEFR